jgi:anti-sigma B factor antagonist
MIEKERTVGQVFILHLEGRINFLNCGQIRERIYKLHEEGRPRLALDFSQVEFMDSSGLATLVEIIQMSRENKFKVRFYSMPEKVQNLIEISGLHRVFPTEENEEAALKALG